MRSACSATLTSEQRDGVGGTQLLRGCGLRLARLVSVVAPVERQRLELRVLERGEAGLAGFTALAGSTAGSAEVLALFEAHREAAASAPGGRRRQRALSLLPPTGEEEEPLDPDEVELQDDPAAAAAEAAADLEAEEEEGAYFEQALTECAGGGPLAPASTEAPTAAPFGSGLWWGAKRAGTPRGLAIQ